MEIHAARLQSGQRVHSYRRDPAPGWPAGGHVSPGGWNQRVESIALRPGLNDAGAKSHFAPVRGQTAKDRGQRTEGKKKRNYSADSEKDLDSGTRRPSPA